MESIEEEEYTTVDDIHLHCPICKDLYIRPRMYPCGHSCCEECMVTMDRLKAQNSIYHTPLYKCPCCRAESIFRWYTRPINHALAAICALHRNHTDRMEESTKDEEPSSVPEDVNLRTLAMESRHHVALDLYERLLPLLYEAAGEGRRHMAITEKTMIRQIELVCDILSQILFERHNVYKVQCTRTECQFIFSDDAFTVLREYTNNRNPPPPPLPTTPVRLLDIDAITQTLNTIQEARPLQMPPLRRRQNNFTEMLQDVEGEGIP